MKKIILFLLFFSSLTAQVKPIQAQLSLPLRSDLLEKPYVTQDRFVTIFGTSVIGDISPEVWRWDDASTATHDGVTVIKPTIVSGAGRYILAKKIATSTDVRPYKVYTALLTQSGTSAPVVIVMENNIGAIVWSRSAVGTYKGTLTGAFTSAKTTVNVSMGGAIGIIQGRSVATNEVTIGTTNNSIIYSDGMLNDAFVEIRVYF